MTTPEIRKAVESADTRLKQSVVMQAQALLTTLEKLHLENITVVLEPTSLSTRLLAKARTVGITGFDEIPVAMLVANPFEEIVHHPYPILPVLILPEPDGMPIAQSPNNEQPYATGFWVFLDNTLQYVVPTEPLPLDGIIRMYDPQRNFDALPNYIDTNRRLHEITDDKQRTKELLAAAGIPVPEGICIAHDEQATFYDRLSHLSEAFDTSRGFVMKARKGTSQGNFVQMFDADALIDPAKRADLEAFADNLFAKGFDIIVERRIIPKAFPAERRVKREETLVETDHNIRTLAGLSTTFPQLIAAEVRFGEMGQNPINISKGAQVALPEEVYDAETVEAVYATTLFVTWVLCNAIAKTPDEAMMGLLGGDIIVEDGTNIPYVIEANGAAVGGFATLTRYGKQPVQAISDIFFKSLGDFLAQNHDRRPAEVNSAKLAPLPLTTTDRINITTYATNAGIFDFAIEQLNEILPTLTDRNAFWLMQVAKVFSLAGRPEAKDYAEIAAGLNANEAVIKRGYAFVLMQTETLETAAQNVGESPEKLLEDPEIRALYIKQFLDNSDEGTAGEILYTLYINNNGNPKIPKELVIAQSLADLYETLGLQEKALQYKQLAEDRIQDIIANMEIIMLDSSQGPANTQQCN